jgi:hypothetical protein
LIILKEAKKKCYLFLKLLLLAANKKCYKKTVLFQTVVASLSIKNKTIKEFVSEQRSLVKNAWILT